jgi:5-formyltetrahydrofolate cyclo-ligase
VLPVGQKRAEHQAISQLGARERRPGASSDTREDGLLDWTTGDGTTETESILGLPEAVGELLGPIAINDVDLIIVPAAAVDATGLRMGWGRGYFDKTLGSMEKCPPVYAVLFDGELVEEVPRELHDQAVDGAVTPTRIVQFS